jgi:ClpP class serine protease
MNNTDLSLLIEIIEKSGGIPLHIVQTTTSNWSQFTISVIITLLSSFFIFIILGEPLIQFVKEKWIIRKFKRLYKKNGRHFLIIKNGDPRGLFNMEGAMIDRKMHINIARKLHKFGGEPIDIYFHTPGGEIFATQAISRLFKNYPGELRAIIPLYAMSGGTYLTLSCDKVLMSNTACLGPIDPQLGNLFKFGSAKAWDKIVKFKGKKAEDSSISFAMMGKQYTKTLSVQIDNLLKDKILDKNKRKKMVKLLTEGSIEHGFPLSKDDLRKHGLMVEDFDTTLNKAGQLLIDSKTVGVYGQ